jgi:hypothetical protein
MMKWHKLIAIPACIFCMSALLGGVAAAKEIEAPAYDITPVDQQGYVEVRAVAHGEMGPVKRGKVLESFFFYPLVEKPPKIEYLAVQFPDDCNPAGECLTAIYRKAKQGHYLETKKAEHAWLLFGYPTAAETISSRKFWPSWLQIKKKGDRWGIQAFDWQTEAPFDYTPMDIDINPAVPYQILRKYYSALPEEDIKHLPRWKPQEKRPDARPATSTELEHHPALAADGESIAVVSVDTACCDIGTHAWILSTEDGHEQEEFLIDFHDVTDKRMPFKKRKATTERLERFLAAGNYRLMIPLVLTRLWDCAIGRKHVVVLSREPKRKVPSELLLLDVEQRKIVFRAPIRDFKRSRYEKECYGEPQLGGVWMSADEQLLVTQVHNYEGPDGCEYGPRYEIFRIPR